MRTKRPPLAQAVRALTTTYLHTLGFVTGEQGVRPSPGERREGFDDVNAPA